MQRTDPHVRAAASARRGPAQGAPRDARHGPRSRAAGSLAAYVARRSARPTTAPAAAVHDPATSTTGAGPCAPPALARLDRTCPAAPHSLRLRPGADADRSPRWPSRAARDLARESFPALGTTALVASRDPRRFAERATILARELAASIDRLQPLPRRLRARRLNRPPASQVAVSDAAASRRSRSRSTPPRSTGGLVDPTVGANAAAGRLRPTFASVRLRDGRLVPPRSRRSPAGGRSSSTRDRRTIRVPAGVELDLGATAKALAADRARRRGRRRRGCGVLVCLGGDVAVAGEPPAAAGRCGSPTTTPRRSTVPGRRRDLRRRPRDVGHARPPLDDRRRSSSTTSSIREPAARRRRPGGPSRSPRRSCVDANAASTAAIVLGERAPAWLGERGAAGAARRRRRDGRRRRRLARERRPRDVLAAGPSALVPDARRRRRRAAAADRVDAARRARRRPLAERPLAALRRRRRSTAT